MIDFGTYNGWKWSEVPISYLEYLVSDECRMIYYRKRNARIELRNRKTDSQIFLFE